MANTVKVGDLVHWNDPCTTDYTPAQLKRQRATVYEVVDIINEDEEVALIKIPGFGSEAEVYFSELTPVKTR